VYIISACLALFAGLFAARAWPVLYDPALLLPLAILVVLRLRRPGRLLLAGLVLLSFGFGLYRGALYMEKIAAHSKLHYQKVTVTGTAREDAVYGKRYQLEFSLGDVRASSPAAGSIIGGLTIRGFGEAAIYRGDVVQVTGKLYPSRGNNLGSISYANLRVIARGTSLVDGLRRQFAAGMQSALPEPAASFALGLVIGQRTTLPEHNEEDLRRAGLTHIIAVSGYNLTVIVLACRRLLAGRSKYQATASCLVLISVFLLITGFSPPIIRASVVSLIALSAWYYGRDVKPHVLLLSSAAITVIANPVYLWGNVSWYLSFLAFYGVLVLAPLVTKRIFGRKEPKLLTSILIESLCATVMVTPYILYIFGETSLVSLLANVLVVPLVPLAMLLSLIAGLGGMFLPLIAGWFAWPASLLLTYILDTASLLGRVPYAYLEDLKVSWRSMTGLYVTIELVMLVLWQKTRKVSALQRSESYQLTVNKVPRQSYHVDQKPPSQS
jgi:competence protein ComEC